MFKKIIYSFFIFTLILIGTSCKKDSEPLSTQKIDGKWKITSSIIKDTNGGADIDLFTDLDACVKDNTYEFTAAGVYIADESSLKCEEEDPQNLTGSYTYTSNDKTLTITTNSFIVVSEVIELSNTTLKTRAFSSPTNPIVTYTKL